MTNHRKVGTSVRPLLLIVLAGVGAMTWAIGLWVGSKAAPDSQDVHATPSGHGAELVRPPDGPTSRPRKTGGPAARSIVRTIEIERGDTLLAVLTRADVPEAEAHAAIRTLRDVFDPRGLLPGHTLALMFRPVAGGQDGEPSFQGFDLQPDVEKTVAIRRARGDGFVARIAETELLTEEVAAAGHIQTSLYGDASAAGVPPPIIAGMIRVLSHEVDFQRQIQPADRFEVLYERRVDSAGEVAGNGDVVFASLTLSGKRMPIYRFETHAGTYDYFNDRGESIRRGLMRTPIDGARLSSGFGLRRHPILGYTRMHRGVDFAAPSGTPILAAGEGVVTRAERNGGYGIYVRIRHDATYSTAYAHLSGIARGIARGTRVRQGQIVGYVGSTGSSTGPHLHYEVHVHGEQVDPLSVDLPAGTRLAATELERFRIARAEIDTAFRVAGEGGHRDGPWVARVSERSVGTNRAHKLQDPFDIGGS